MKALFWKQLSAARQAAALKRPAQQAQQRTAVIVAGILAQVRRQGDRALRRFAAKFDGAKLQSLRVSAAEFAAAEKALAPADRAALRRAYANIRKFHLAQRPKPVRVETTRGIVCEKVSRPIGRVGLYVPGGSAPLFSTALMLGVPSQIASEEAGRLARPEPGRRAPVIRVLCTPPGPDGKVSPWILCAARLCGIKDVFKVGGAQAIAAMAYGTATIPKCDKLFGPGNRYVTEAKVQVSRDAVAIDLPAGPSEVMVIADRMADPAFVAADLLSQAEHGPDSQVILVTFSESNVVHVGLEMQRQLKLLPRGDIAKRALKQSRVILVASRAEAIEVANRYAPEHLILQVEQPRRMLSRLTSAGSVFVGKWTPESLGDYASGTNHVLPTYGWARACSGLGLADFQRSMTVQEASPLGFVRLAPTVARLAEAENLAAHRRAVIVRLKHLAARAS